MNKYFHGLLFGVSVLPALLVMPAMAETISNYTQIDNQTVNWGNGTENVTINNYVDVFNSGRLVVDAGSNGTINMNSDLWVVTQAKVNGVYHGNTTTYSTATFTAKNVNFNTDGVALWVQNNTDNATDVSTINITADNININSTQPGLVEDDGYYATIIAMSQGTLNINGNTKITSDGNAILTRGYAHVNINEAADKKTQIDGNVVFNYKRATSNTNVDAFVNIGLNGSDSYWNGNTMVAWDDYKPTVDKLEVNSATLTIKNGAIWNATQIRDFEEDYGTSYNMGQYYTALNNLIINNGTVNIADTTRGIVVENANVADATFNGGALNIGTMNLTGGTNTFNNNVVGVNDSSALNIASGATMNIGTNAVNVKNITLDGTMLATLRDGDAQITAGTFGGDGTLKLSLNGEGTYNVFGDAAFRNAGIEVTSSLYDLTWNGGVATATKKSVAAIAEENGIEQKTAAALSGMSQSTSEKLNDLAVLMQEKLASGNVADRVEAEKIATAIHPETESVAQSMTAAVQTAVTNLAGARMAAPTVGRSGGDITMTSGGVWAQGLLNKSKQNDAFRGYTRGIAVGMDGTLNKVWTLGAGYSYAHSDVSGSERTTEIDSNTVFLYGQYKPAAWYVNAVANYTMGDYSEEGALVTDDYDVDSFGASLATGYDLDFGLTPELGLRYMYVMPDDHTNSLGVKTKSDNTNFLTGVLGAKYAFNVNMDRYTSIIPQLNAALKYDMLSDKNVATVTMPGVDAYTLDVERLSRFGGEFGIGLGMKHRGMDFSINYDIDVRKDYTSQTGMLKFRYNF